MADPLPTFQFQLPTDALTTGTPDFSKLMEVLKIQGPSMTNLAVPAIANLTGQASQFLQPQIAAIQKQTGANVAAAQSESMRRGLTGSDIEAASLTGEREAGLAAEAGVRAQFGLQQVQTLSNAIMQSLSSDIGQNRQILMNLAQAMGQEITAQRDMEMFAKQIQALMIQAGMTQEANEFGAKMGLVGEIGGAAVIGGAIIL